MRYSSASLTRRLPPARMAAMEMGGRAWFLTAAVLLVATVGAVAAVLPQGSDVAAAEFRMDRSLVRGSAGEMKAFTPGTSATPSARAAPAPARPAPRAPPA